MSELDKGILRAAFDAQDAGLMVVDGNRRVVAWNAWMVLASGVSTQEAVGKHLGEIFPVRALDVLSAAVSEALRSGVARLLTDSLNPALLPLKTHDGRELVHDISVQPLGHGARSLCLIQVTEMTALVDRERVLRERENTRYFAFVNSAPIAILTLDVDGRIQLANPAAARELGYQARELVGEPIEIVFGKQKAWEDVWNAALEGKAIHRAAEVTARRRDGSISCLEVSVSQWISDERVSVMVILREANERRAAEEELRRQNELTRTLIDHAPNAFFLLDATGRVQVANPAAEQLLGWRQHEMVGHILHDLCHHHHQDGHPFSIEECPLARAHRSGHVLDSYETVFFRRDGSPVDVICSCAPILDADGQVAGSVQLVSDISVRKRAEEGRQLLVRELNHRVKNLFAIAAGMVSMSARSARDPREMAQVLTGRLMALARAHELIRPAVTSDSAAHESVALHELITALVIPLVSREDQLRVDGPAIIIGPNCATSLALVLHELATNAAKYGALSVAEGCLDVRWQAEEGHLSLSWQELNGPAIQAPPERNGFGSQLVRMSASGQLGGSVTYEWASTGVLIVLRIPLERLQR